jgi:thiol-disulfide isomerase/thioredoxin
MSFFSKFLVSIFLTLALVGCGGGGTSSSQESFVSGNGLVTLIKPQDRIGAPELAGMTLSGTNYSHVPGRVAVVNVWASWCSPCRAEAPALVALAKKYSEVTFIGILTRDNLASAKAFERRFAIPYPTLIDDSILIGFKGSLSANAIPTTVVIDRNGKVAGRISGAITVASLSNLIETVSNE